MDGADRRFDEQTVKLSRRTLARLSLLILDHNQKSLIRREFINCLQ